MKKLEYSSAPINLLTEKIEAPDNAEFTELFTQPDPPELFIRYRGDFSRPMITYGVSATVAGQRGPVIPHSDRVAFHEYLGRRAGWICVLITRPEEKRA